MIQLSHPYMTTGKIIVLIRWTFVGKVMCLVFNTGPTRPFRTNTKSRCPFHIGYCNAKIGRQEIPGVTGKFGLEVQNEAGKRLTEFCQENTLVIENTLFQQPKRWLYTWTSPDNRYKNKMDYVLCSQRQRSSIQSAKKDLELWLRSSAPYCKIQAQIEESSKNHKAIQEWPKSNPLWLYNVGDE